MMKASTKRTWISLLIAGFIIIGISAVTVVLGSVFFVTRHISTQFTPNASAEERFAETRARFGSRPPLIELRHGNQPVLHRELESASSDASGKLQALCVLTYDPRAGKIVSVSVPFWLLRLAPAKHFSFLGDNGLDFDSDRAQLTFHDLERLGPGLILDERNPRGSRVLVWTE
jgi:hypothetical protein